MKNQYLLSDEEDPQLKNSLTPGTSDQAPPPVPPAPPTMAAPPALAAAPQPQMPPPQMRPLPGMPPSVTPDEIGNYLGRQKTSMQKFGPDQQVELEKNLMAQRNGLGYKIADAGKGFADALMQGVARAGNPGWQQQFENQNMAQGAEQMGVLQKAHEQQVQSTEANMKLDMMDKKSALSKSYQQAAAPIFSKMGITPDKLGNMPASQIETIAELGLKSEDIQMQGELKKLMLQFQAMTGMAGIENNKSQRKQEAAKGLAGLGVMGGIIHPEAKKAFTSELEDGSGSSGPYGSTVNRNGKTYQWSAATNKYHPVN